MNPKLNRQFHALLKKTGLTAQKADLVRAATNDRTEKSSEMTDVEITTLIKKLQADAPPSKYTQMLNEWANTNEERKIYGLFRELGYILSNNKPDYDRINNYCLTRSAAKKTIKEMTTNERTALVKQLYQLKKASVKP
jgi:hypothetical protein